MTTSTTPASQPRQPSQPSPPTPTRLTARSPADLLAVVPVVLGFWPADSVVMLTFGAAQAFHARVDLPDDPRAMAELAEVLLAPAVHHRVERVVLVIYSDDSERVAAAWRALRRAFRRRRIPVVEALRVGEERWFPLRQAGASGRPGGTRYDRCQIGSHPFLAQSVLDGRVTHLSRDDLAATLEPVVQRVAAIEAQMGARATDRSCDELDEAVWVHTTVGRHLADGTSASDPDAARLLAAMTSLVARDAAWATIRRARSREAVAFFADLMRRSPREVLPAVAALTAWSAWQAGDGALAWCAIDRCRDVDPDYGLAALIVEALERAIPPSVWDDPFDWKGGHVAGQRV